MALTKGTNSYANLTDANDYFADDLRAATWTALSDTVKEQSLVTASRQISRAVRDSCKLPLQVADITPQLIQAASELGLVMATNPSSISQGNTGSNLRRAVAGSAQVEFFRPTTGSRFPSLVMQILRDGDCIDTAAGSSGGSERFGTTDRSQFSDGNRYGRNRGFF